MTAKAVTPAPDGGYPNGNTAEGDNAFLALQTAVTTRLTVPMRLVAAILPLAAARSRTTSRVAVAGVRTPRL